MAGITAQALSIGAALNDFYVVPDYQRGYVWERKEVQKLLDDMHREFSINGSQGEYFIGPSVVCPAPNGAFEITDGQQRLTTIFLLFCAIKNHLKEYGASPIAQLETKLAAPDVDPMGRDIFRYRVILGYEDSATLLQTISQDESRLDSIKASSSSIENIVNSYKYSRAFLRDQFKNDVDMVKTFYAFLTKNVKTARVETAARSQALRVFETVNHRGVSLGSMDLLKNLIVQHTPEKDLAELKTMWKELMDRLYISSSMSKSYQRDRQYRFLLQFIRSTFKVMDMPDDMLYDWFWKHPDCGYATRPIGFVKDLLESAKSSYVR